MKTPKRNGGEIQVRSNTGGEIWAVVKVREDNPFSLPTVKIFTTREQAILNAAHGKKTIAIFKPFETGGKWTEGQGLELIEGEKK